MYNNVEIDFFFVLGLLFGNIFSVFIYLLLYSFWKFLVILVGLFWVFRFVNCILLLVSFDFDIWFNLKVNMNYILDYYDDDLLE